MCGIVGLFLKDDSLSPRLGGMLSDMLVTMTDRGPDSAGIAVYGAETSGSPAPPYSSGIMAASQPSSVRVCTKSVG